jgi:hypothetical protein
MIIKRPFRLIIPLIAIILLGQLQYHLGLFGKPDPSHKLQTVNFFMDVFIRPVLNVVFQGPRWRPMMMPSWTLSHEFRGSTMVYILTAIIIGFKEGSRQRYMVLLTVFCLTLWTNRWEAFFISGLIIAELDVSGVLRRYKSWKYAGQCNIGLLSFITYFGLVSRFTLGRYTDEVIRSYQLSNDQGF